METLPVRYGILRDRRHWEDGVALDDLWREPGGVLILPDGVTESRLETTSPLDAGQRSEWLRIKVTAEIPPGTDVELRFFAGNQPDAPTEDQWHAAQSLDTLIHETRSDNGRDPLERPFRYLWLRVILTRRGTSAPSPRLLQIQVQTPGENYLDYLPALYRRSDSPDHFLERWLALFQAQLGDREQLLEMMPRRFDPLMTPESHLPWLAGWLGFELPPKECAAAWLIRRFPEELPEDFDREDAWRELLPRLYRRLYGRRGTPFGLQEFVELYTGVRPHVFEAFQEQFLWQLAPDRAVVRCGKCGRLAEPASEACEEIDWAWNQTSRLGINTGLAAMSPGGMVVSGFHRPDPRYQGLRGEYYADEFRVLRFSRIDPQVKFNWTSYEWPGQEIESATAVDSSILVGSTVDRNDGSDTEPAATLASSLSSEIGAEPLPDYPGFIDQALHQPLLIPRVDPPTKGEPGFSVRWTGQVRFPHSETVTFYTQASGGVRLWLGGRLIIEAWGQQDDQERSGRVAMEADRWYPIRLEYFRFVNTKKAHITLSWASRRIPRQVIPSTYLYADIDESVAFDAPFPDNEASATDNAFLVGQTVVGETGPLDRDDFGMPLFGDTAHLFTVMVPAAAAPTAGGRRAIKRILERETPAHTDYHLCFVEPTMQVGHQARLGIDSIVGRHVNPDMRVGSRARLGITSILAKDDESE